MPGNHVFLPPVEKITKFPRSLAGTRNNSGLERHLENGARGEVTKSSLDPNEFGPVSVPSNTPPPLPATALVGVLWTTALVSVPSTKTDSIPL